VGPPWSPLLALADGLERREISREVAASSPLTAELHVASSLAMTAPINTQPLQLVSLLHASGPPAPEDAPLD